MKTSFTTCKGFASTICRTLKRWKLLRQRAIHRPRFTSEDKNNLVQSLTLPVEGRTNWRSSFELIFSYLLKIIQKVSYKEKSAIKNKKFCMICTGYVCKRQNQKRLLTNEWIVNKLIVKYLVNKSWDGLQWSKHVARCVISCPPDLYYCVWSYVGTPLYVIIYRWVV